MGFIIHFYIIFGTNLLTGSPAQICCFMPISVFRGKGISDGVKTERNQLEKLFLEGKPPMDLESTSRDTGGARGAHEGGGRPVGQARLPTSWPPQSFVDFNSKSPGCYSSQKSRCRRFHSFWTSFDIPFLRNTEIGKNNNMGWASG